MWRISAAVGILLRHAIGILRLGQVAALKLVSLDGLGLEAVLDKQAGCGVCKSVRIRPALQAS